MSKSEKKATSKDEDKKKSDAKAILFSRCLARIAINVQNDQ